MTTCMEMTLARVCAMYNINPESLVDLLQVLGKVNPEDKEKLIWQATGAATVFSKFGAEQRSVKGAAAASGA